MALFAIPEISGLDTLSYWNIAAFVRLFGAALFGYGLLLWSFRKTIDKGSHYSQRGFLSALFLGNLIAAVVTLTQQIIVWQNWIGWIIFGQFLIFLLAYGFFLFFPSKTILANTDLNNE